MGPGRHKVYVYRKTDNARRRRKITRASCRGCGDDAPSDFSAKLEEGRQRVVEFKRWVQKRLASRVAGAT